MAANFTEKRAAERLLTTREAAELMRVSMSFLVKARVSGTGPPYRKIGRAVRYAEVDVHLHLRDCRRLSTAQG
jgi:hypothetical protein